MLKFGELRFGWNMPSHESRQWQRKIFMETINFPTANNVSKSTKRLLFKTQQISHFDVRALLDDAKNLSLSVQSVPKSHYTTVGVLCEQSVMLINMNNSQYFSHFFLLAALLLSVALSHKALIRTAAEFTQHSWRLRTLYSACPCSTPAKCIYQVCQIWMDWCGICCLSLEDES